jgi:PST family polysaccharide transporter/lipopolysaccharide exporter
MADHQGTSDGSLPDRLGAATGTAVSWRAAQHVGVRLISLIKFLVLARILDPSDFGLLAIAAVAVDLLVSLTDFGMVTALVQRPRVHARHYDTAWSVNLTRSLVIAAVIAAGAPVLASLFGEPRATEVLRVLALRPMLDAAASIRVADLTRELRFGALAAIRLSTAVADAIVAISLASAFGVWAVVIGALTGAAVGSVISYVVAPYRPRVSFDTDAARSLFRFGRWILLAGVLGVAGDAVLRAVISRRLGAADLGVYYVAVRVAILPYEAISEIVTAVAFPVQALLQNDRARAARVFRSTLKAPLALLIPVYATLVALAEPAARYLLGAQWDGAAPVIRVIAVIAVIGTIYDSTAAMLQGLGRPQWVAALAAVQLPIVAALAWALAGALGVTGAALARLVAETAVQISAGVMAARLLPRPFAGMARPILAFLVAAGAAAGASLLIFASISGVWGAIFGAAVGVTVGAAVLLLLDRAWALGLREDASKAFPTVMAWLRLAPAPARRNDVRDGGAA